MNDRTTIDKVRNLFRKSADVEQEYEPIESDASALDEEARRPVLILPEEEEGGGESEPFSWLEYSIFLLLGIAMLWAWYVELRGYWNYS
jgi:equilibrative nucleoside transporter 1/2/3